MDTGFLSRILEAGIHDWFYEKTCEKKQIFRFL